MGRILVLGLAAAVYPQLLAVVVVILTRPSPRPLLWACYLGSLVVSVGCSVAILAIFRSRGTLLGTSSRGLSSAAYLIVGAIALAIAMFAASHRGRELLSGGVPRVRPRRRGNQNTSGSTGGARSKAERALKQGSLPVAAAFGAILAVPGPFDLLALGHLARVGYTTIVVGIMVVAFLLLKFLLIEVPIVSYMISPERTAASVGRFSSWMQTNKIEVIAGVVGVIGLGLVGRGVSGLT